MVLFLGLLVTLAWNMAYILLPGALPRHDFTPVVFGLAGVIVAWGLFRFRLFTLVPVARRVLVDNMKDGLLVLDETDRVVDLNEAARALIDRPARGHIGAAARRDLGGLASTGRALRRGH